MTLESLWKNQFNQQRNSQRILKQLLISAVLVMLVTTDQPVLAQETRESSALEEVIVSARRYNESLQDAPVAVNAMTGEFLEAQGITTVDAALLNSPGASFTEFNKMQAEYGMRGVSSQTEGASGDSSVTTIIDNVAVSKDFMKNPSFFDMERVEVLRGPQGTAFGRNASSGLVHLVTAKPAPGNSAGVSANAGSHGKLGVQGFINGALSESLAGRLALNADSYDGYNEDTRTNDDIGGSENVAVRGSLLWEANENVQVYLKAELNKDNDDQPAIRKGADCTIPYQLAGAPSVVGAPQPGWIDFPAFTDSCDPWETTISDSSFSNFFLDREIVNLTAEINWTVSENVSLTSVTGWLDGESEYFIDAHGGPNNSLFQNTANDAEMFSQEIRFDNHGSGAAFRWLAGLYFMQDEHSRFDQNIFFAENASSGPPGGTPNPAGGFFRPETRDIKDGYSETESLGVFGEVTVDLSSQLNITAGIRYSRDEKDYKIAHYGWGWGGPIDTLVDFDANGDPIPGTECTFAPGAGLFYCGDPDNPVGFVRQIPTDDSWDNISGKVSLQYAINDEKMVYGLISQGYKTGGFQPEPKNPGEALIPFEEETVINYEFGFKGDFGGRFRLNAAAFFTQYDDLQLFLFKTNASGDFFQAAENASNVDILGLELDYVWQATDNLRFSGNLALIDAELTDALIDTDGDGVPEDFDGTRPDNTAEWTSTLVVEYDITLNSGAYVSLRADWRGNSEVFDDIGEQEARRHDDYQVVGARVTWTAADGNWTIALWGKNLFEEEYTVNVGPAQPNINQLNFSFGPPRTYGATLHFDF